MVLLTIKEMEDVLGVSSNTFRRLLKDEELPHYRVGRQLRFDLPEVLRHLHVRTTSESPSQWGNDLEGVGTVQSGTNRGYNGGSSGE